MARHPRLTERTIVIVIGDHGESLNEHGEGTHGLFIYEATTRVPFIVRAPYSGDARAARAWRRPLRGRHADGARSGRPRAPVEGMEGRSLVPLMTGASSDLNLDAYTESLYARNHYGWSELRSLRSGRFKYISAHASRALRPRARSRGTQEHHRRARSPRRAHGAGAPASRRGSCRTAQRPVCRSIPKRASGLPRSATSDRSSIPPGKQERRCPIRRTRSTSSI